MNGGIELNPYQRSLRYVQTSLLPKLQEKFQRDSGKNVTQVQFVHDDSKKGEDQFQSVAIFGTIVYESDESSSVVKHTKEEANQNHTKEEDESKNRTERSVIIKMQIGDEHSLQWNNGGVQFLNEMIFYDDFLPHLSSVVSDVQEIFPKLVYGYYSESGSRTQDILILEDLVKKGYQLTTSKTKLSTEHILLALQSLGKFHAASHILKSIDKETFFRKVNAVRNVRNWVTDPKDTFQHFLARNGERGLWHLESNPAYKGKLDRVRHFLANISDSLLQTFETNEWSVLIHGDFCRNNMFFKYNSNDHPISVKFFDMANISYASPVIDISFLIYLNTDQQQRIKDWDKMIRVYYHSLSQTCHSYAESSKVKIRIPTFENILEDFKVKSMMGYLTCSFFLPVMMQKIPEDAALRGRLSEEEHIQHRLETSGEEGTKAVGEILMHILDNDFI